MNLRRHGVPIILLFPVVLQPVLAQTLPLPVRSPGAPPGVEIIRALSPLSREGREDSLFHLVMGGNIPDFLRTLVPITSSAPLAGGTRAVTYYVTPDYLAVGSNEDYFLTPMTPLLAQRLADEMQCSLPTRKMVNDIYAAAPCKLAPAPIAPSAEMVTVPVFAQHDSMVWAQRCPQLSAFPLGTLVGGTKKDVVISNKIRNDLRAGVPRPVVIYGWHQLNGVPIQSLYNGHGETYADYSHGIRLVQQAVRLDGMPATVSGILTDANLSALLSDEGSIPYPRYGDSPAGVDEDTGGSQDGTRMFQNFPNPFNPGAVIRYHLAAVSDVRIVVCDLLGREVRRLVDEREGAGSHEVRFDAAGLAAGVYIYRLTSGNHTESRRMVLVR